MDKTIKEIIKLALEEDRVLNDITTKSTIPKRSTSRAMITSEQDGVVSGLEVARQVFRQFDKNVKFRKFTTDGNEVAEKQILAELNGSSRSILSCERVALNFISHLSGVATKAAEFTSLVKGTRVKLLDTRKTTPGLRTLEKYATRQAGFHNHRFNLEQMVLIKDNHIRAAGSINIAVQKARKTKKKIEVEAETIQHVEEALLAGADVIMLDNMTVDKVKEAVKLAKGKAVLEVSGNINKNNIKNYAKTGVDTISIGTAVTLSAPAFKVRMEFI